MSEIIDISLNWRFSENFHLLKGKDLEIEAAGWFSNSLNRACMNGIDSHYANPGRMGEATQTKGIGKGKREGKWELLARLLYAELVLLHMPITCLARCIPFSVCVSLVCAMVDLATDCHSAPHPLLCRESIFLTSNHNWQASWKNAEEKLIFVEKKS